MKARIIIVTVVGSFALVTSPAYAGVRGAQPARQVQFVITGDGGSPVAPIKRAPAALTHRTAKLPWEAPNRDQVSRNAI